MNWRAQKSKKMPKNWMMLGLLALVCELFALGYAIECRDSIDHSYEKSAQTLAKFVKTAKEHNKGYLNGVRKVCDYSKCEKSIKLHHQSECVERMEALLLSAGNAREKMQLAQDSLIAIAPDSANSIKYYIGLAMQLNPSGFPLKVSKSEQNVLEKLGQIHVQLALMPVVKYLSTQVPHIRPEADSAFIVVSSYQQRVQAGKTWMADIYPCFYETHSPLTMTINGRPIQVVNGLGRDTIFRLPKHSTFDVEIARMNQMLCFSQKYRHTYSYPELCK
jgi:hypothetical protein